MNTGRRNVLKMMGMGMGAAGLAFAPFVKATDILDEATMSRLTNLPQTPQGMPQPKYIEPVVYEGPDVIIRQIDEHTWEGNGHLMANETIYIIEGNERTILLDAGTKIDGLKKIVESITKKPITLIATHVHPDHTGSAIHDFDEIWINAGDEVNVPMFMTDYKGKKVKEAPPSTPVEILGLGDVPVGGDTFYVVENERMAKEVIEARKFKEKNEMLSARKKVSLDDLFSQINEGEVKDLNIIVKADVQGSVEAVKQSLVKLTNEEVRVNIIHGAVGAVNESDVMLADASNAIIVGFNVRPTPDAASSADEKGVDMRLYRVIYEAIEEIEAAMKGMLAPKYKEAVTGHAEIRQTFRVSGVGTIAGVYITDGKIGRGSLIRIVRDGIVVYDGSLSSLKRFKDDAKEVAQGYECGMSFEKFNDIKEGDIVEAYIMEEIER